MGRAAGWVLDVVGSLLDPLRAHKMRTALTIASITWGTLSIILLLAFGFGMEAHMKARSLGIGEAVCIAWPARTSIAFEGFGAGRPIRLTRDDVLRLPGEIPELEAVSSEFIERQRVRREGRVFLVPVTGVDPDYRLLRQMRPRAGSRFLHAGDLSNRRRVAFLGDAVARDLFDDDDPVGRTVDVAGTPFAVVGVLAQKDQDSDYDGLDADRICIPATTFTDVLGRRHIDDFVFRARDPARQAQVTSRVYEELGRIHRFDPKDTEALKLWDLTEQQRMIAAIYFGMNALFGLSGVFTLLVGCVGVANLLYLMVRWRTAEFGLQMAVGATPRRILVQVMSQSLCLVLLGGGVGYLIAMVAVAAVAGNEAMTASVGAPTISSGLALGTAGLLMLVGLLAGYFPARRAARLDPVTALSEKR